jgi:predicted outer membrane repeat protein
MGIRARFLLLGVLCVSAALFSACTLYDPDLSDPNDPWGVDSSIGTGGTGAVPGSGGTGATGPGAGTGATPGSGGTGAVPGSGGTGAVPATGGTGAVGGAGGVGGTGGTTGDAGECIPNPSNPDCPEICPEECDAIDNDCDGLTDEAEAAEDCPALDNATVKCVMGVCEVDVCVGLFGNCDNDHTNGCETTLGTNKNCSACGDNCSKLDNVTSASCESAVCVIAGCETGFEDCDQDPSNGCEHDLNTGPCEPDVDHFVDASATGANDGTSWENAHANLAAALTAATSGEKIGVKAGTYSSAPYALKAGVEVYGGFDPALTGTNGALAGRDPATHQTIIDGGGSQRCLTGASNAVLDGFIVQNGSAGVGGGLYLDADTNVSVAGCVFKSNEADDDGGAISVGTEDTAASIKITDTTFEDNTAVVRGGALFITETDDSATIDGCLFKGNSAGLGGAIRNKGTADIKNSVFDGNDADNDQWGGGAIITITTLTIDNCLFIKNSANVEGGAIHHEGTTNINNCTFNQNAAIDSGGDGGAIFRDVGTINVIDSILWGNTAAGSPEQMHDVSSVTYSAVEGGWSGVGNTDQDPEFVTGDDGGYYLSHTASGQGVDSPCIDTGSDTSSARGLNNRTTRTDNTPDTGQVDMGYHYAP